MRGLSSSSHPRDTIHADPAAVNPATKVLLLLAFVVPVAAYVAGSLGGPGGPEPADRGPVILRDAPTTPANTRAPGPTRTPAPQPAPQKDRDREGTGQDEARVVTPLPTPVGEDDDDEWDDDGPEDDTTDDERDD